MTLLEKLQKLKNDRRGEGWIADFIGLCITLVLAVYMLPIVIDAIDGTDTTLWNFTGHAGAATLFSLIPFIFIVGVLLFFVARLIQKAIA